MGWFDDLFGSSKQSVAALPPYLEEFYKGQVMPRLTGMVDRPYPVYENPRIEDFAPEEEQAFQYASANVTNPEWRPYIDRSTAMTEAGAQAYNPALLGGVGKYDPALVGDTPTLSSDAVAKYMNPYKSTVVDSAVERINQSADRAALRDRGRATRTGNLYSAGHGIVDAERDAGVAREIGDTTGRLMDEGYKTALGQFNTDVGRQLQTSMADVQAKNRAIEYLMSQGLTREQANQAAQNQGAQFNRTQAMAGARQMQTLGGDRQNLRNQDYAALKGVGAARRGLGQQNLDLAYKDFRDQYEWPLENISKLSQVAGGQPYTKTQTETSNNSVFNNVAGAALVGSRAFPGVASTVSGWLGLADGGMVPDIRGPKGPTGPALAHGKRRATMTPGRQDYEGLPPPGTTLTARKTGYNRFAA